MYSLSKRLYRNRRLWWLNCYNGLSNNWRNLLDGFFSRRRLSNRFCSSRFGEHRLFTPKGWLGLLNSLAFFFLGGLGFLPAESCFQPPEVDSFGKLGVFNVQL
jgi:hypothetical protein